MDLLIKFFKWHFSKKSLPYWLILLLDSTFIVIACILSLYICYGGSVLTNHFWTHLIVAVMALPFVWVAMKVFHTYSGILRYSSINDLYRITCALSCAAVAYYIVCHIVKAHFLWAEFFTLKVGLLALIMSVALMSFMRIIARVMYDLILEKGGNSNVLIYGVRQGGLAIALSIRNERPAKYTVKGFLSPEPTMVGRYLMGNPIYSENDVTDVIKKHNIKCVYVSPIVSDKFRNNEELVNTLTKHKVKIKMMHSVEEWDGKSELSYSQLQHVEIEDLLPRDPIKVDLDAIGNLLHGKRILITGAAGSIGSEMARQVAKFGPFQLILIDQAETPMHDVRLYMANKYPKMDVQTIVGNIANKTHMEDIFSVYKPEYVFHAAAYKHVPMMEDNPAMAVQNNVYGTRVIADLAVKYGTKKFVMISTDKAVNPTNVMGCSKRICEIYCQALNRKLWNETQETGKPTTQFITTRFGNVLGSNGSVIPLFREQIKKGGPLTVTHPDIIRYFMLIPEACQLVLEAGTMGNGGEIFVFDMGKPVRIADLAQRMIDLSGAKNVEIKFTGLRPGEKLFEEVLNDAEQTKPTVHPKIKVASVREYPYEKALQNEEELYQLSFTYNDMEIVRKMKEIVPEYKSRQSKYEALD